MDVPVQVDPTIARRSRSSGRERGIAETAFVHEAFERPAPAAVETDPDGPTNTAVGFVPVERVVTGLDLAVGVVAVAVKENVPAGMTMLGDGVFAYGKKARELLSTFGEVYEFHVSPTGPRIVEENI
jgi:hypothetical protein